MSEPTSKWPNSHEHRFHTFSSLKELLSMKELRDQRKKRRFERKIVTDGFSQTREIVTIASWPKFLSRKFHHLLLPRRSGKEQGIEYIRIRSKVLETFSHSYGICCEIHQIIFPKKNFFFFFISFPRHKEQNTKTSFCPFERNFWVPPSRNIFFKLPHFHIIIIHLFWFGSFFGFLQFVTCGIKRAL